MIKDIANSFKEYENVRNGNLGLLSLAQITYASTNMSQAKKNLPKWQFLNVKHCFEEYCTKTDKNIYNANTLYSETIKIYYHFDFWGCIKQYAGDSPIVLAWKETDEKVEMRKSYLLLKDEYMKSHDNSIIEKINTLEAEFQKINELINDEDSLIIRAFESGEIEKSSKSALKSKYCKHCGSALDNNKKCTGCGKQYFKIPKIKLKTLSMATLLIIICFLGYMCFSLYNKTEILESDLIAMTEERDSFKISHKEQTEMYEMLLSEYNEIKNAQSKSLEAIKTLREERNNYKDIADYWNKYGAITVDSDKKYYHTYSCFKIQNSPQYYVDIKWDSENMGYKPCPYCH